MNETKPPSFQPWPVIESRYAVLYMHMLIEAAVRCHARKTPEAWNMLRSAIADVHEFLTEKKISLEDMNRLADLGKGEV